MRWGGGEKSRKCLRGGEARAANTGKENSLSLREERRILTLEEVFAATLC